MLFVPVPTRGVRPRLELFAKIRQAGRHRGTVKSFWSRLNDEADDFLASSLGLEPIDLWAAEPIVPFVSP